MKSAAFNTIRAASEYKGQKCSANSRIYVAESVWPEFKHHLQEQISQLRVGDVEDYGNFINPVIQECSFDKLQNIIESAKNDLESEVVTGGKASKEEGYYVHPIIYKTSSPRHDIISQEIFSPILGVYVYPDTEWEETLKFVDTTSRYQYALRQAQTALKHSAGMLYLNTKCTGSVVGQQPFGGSRDSGTNYKTGTMAHWQRFVSTRTVNEEFRPLEKVQYSLNEV